LVGGAVLAFCEFDGPTLATMSCYINSFQDFRIRQAMS